MKYTWYETSGRGNWLLAVVAFLATMVFIDGLLMGDILRALAGAIVAWVFWTFTFKGIPIPQRVAASVSEQVGRAMSVDVNSNSRGFRWTMVALGALLGVGTIAGACAILFASPEDIELFVPSVAYSIRRAEAHDLGRLARLGYAAAFLGAAYAFLLTMWKRARA